MDERQFVMAEEGHSVTPKFTSTSINQAHVHAATADSDSSKLHITIE